MVKKLLIAAALLVPLVVASEAQTPTKLGNVIAVGPYTNGHVAQFTTIDGKPGVSDGGAPAAGSTPANPTATIGTAAVNGSASTFMRSDAAPAIPQCSSSTFGACKVDGTTITASAGVISATGGGSSGISGLTTGQVGVAGSATTITSSVPYGETGNSTIIKTTSSGLLQPSILPATVVSGATSATVTAAQWAACSTFVVNTAAQTLTLPVATSLAVNGCINLQTQGVTVTLAPNAADGINGGSINTSVLIPADTSTAVTTTGSSGTGAFTVPLGPIEYKNAGWASGAVVTGSVPLFRAGTAKTISALYCLPEVVVGGTATIDWYTAASGVALSGGTKLNTNPCNANTGATTEQSLGVASASIPAGNWVGVVFTGAGWAANTGFGDTQVNFR